MAQLAAPINDIHQNAPNSLVNKQRYKFKMGDKCKVYSHSNQKWFNGTVIEENNTLKGPRITVQYRVGTNYTIKKLKPDDKHLKPLDINNDNDIVQCVCGETMIWLCVVDCYKDDNTDDQKQKDDINVPINMIDEKSSPSPSVSDLNLSTVSCDNCGYQFSKTEKCFHCPKEATAIHKYGSDLCQKCALCEDDQDVQNVNDDEIDDDAIAIQMGDEPFAEGSSRFAYLGLWQTGKKKGTRCVIKRYKDQHMIFDDGYDGDIKCCKLAAELVTEWNAMDLIDKKYEIVVPIIARKQGLAWKIELEMILLMTLLGMPVEVEELKLMLNSTTVGDHVQSGELVMIEDYLTGEFLKWNSNSGWMDKDEMNISVQAFCHWTYHYGKGQYLFCDAQGVKKPDKYILTDPAILSNTIKGGLYGVTDMGKLYLLNWFRQHDCSCNKFCNDNWLKPTQMDLHSVPQMVRKSIKQATSFNKSTLLKSKKKSTVIMSKAKLSTTSALAAIPDDHDIDDDNKNDNNNNLQNKYDNPEWEKYEKYLSWQNNERIIICGNVIREKTFSSQKRVLVLSSFEKLYIINPSNDNYEEEYSKSMVKKVELKKYNKFKFILHLKTNKIWFTLTGNKKSTAKTWKQLIDNNMSCK